MSSKKEVMENMINQYKKIVSIIKEEAEKKGMAFICYGYFRSSDSIKDGDATHFATCTDLEPYDQYFAVKEFKDFIER